MSTVLTAECTLLGKEMSQDPYHKFNGVMRQRERRNQKGGWFSVFCDFIKNCQTFCPSKMAAIHFSNIQTQMAV